MRTAPSTSSVKDLGIVLEAGRDAKVALPLAAVAHQLFVASSGAARAQPTTARSSAATTC
jgi:3-hydroxyisobutyrate dehydrogenase-like beta-hydroxyacid dehydrogenase